LSILIVDILCCQSLYKIVRMKEDINTVYYYSLSKYISVIVKLVSSLKHIQFKNFSEFPSSALYQNQRSYYEEFEMRLTYFCNLYFNTLNNNSTITEYCLKNQLDLLLTKKHIWQNAYWLLYRPVEIIVKSEFLNAKDGICFIFRNSPVIPVLAPTLKKNNAELILYQYLGFSSLLINREEYIFDEYIRDVYFNNSLFCAFKTLRESFLIIVNSFCYKIFGNRIGSQANRKANKATIGVDKYLTFAEEECFWFRDSQINPENIYFFEERKPYPENINFLSLNKIKRAHIVNNPIEWFKMNINCKNENRQLLAADWDKIKKHLGSYLMQLLKCLAFHDNECKWIMLMLLQLRVSYELWKNIFQKLDLKLLISFSDIDYKNAAKIMAANYSNGIVLGGHLSNQAFYSIQTERFYHVAFVWGPHFYSHLFEQYPYEAVVMTGYYFDCTFKEHYSRANKIRMNYPDNFIITFMDNVFYQDITNSAETIQEVYRLFFNIIDLYPTIIFFIKTKRAEVFEKTKKVVPAIDNYIKRGKIVPFVNDADTSKPYKPACVALASDLVIGLGIGTAATESEFAGVPSFHFDLSKTENNHFVKTGLGKIVFQSMESMKEAIERQINPETALSFEKIDYYYKDFDPFRDGRAAERVGAYLKLLVDGFNKGLGRDAAISNATELYCHKWGYDKVISIKKSINSQE